MNAGLSNLATLKRHLLPGTMLTDTQFDATITQLGLGVAGALEKYCNRKFQRTAGDTCTFTGDRDHFYLPRSPVEAVSAVALKTSEAGGFVAQTGAIQNSDGTNGWIYFGAYLGDRYSLVRVTYTGGFWWDTTEDDTGVMPAGATAIAADLQTAWLLLCEAVWAGRDKLGTGLIEKPDAAAGAEMELTLQVKQMLSGFRRMQLT